MLPAQFVIFFLSAQVDSGVTIAAERRLRNVRLFIHARELNNAALADPSHNRCHWGFGRRSEYARGWADDPLRISPGSPEIDGRTQSESRDCGCDSRTRWWNPILRSRRNACGRDTSSLRPF